jgi:hypothetical protein
LEAWAATNSGLAWREVLMREMTGNSDISTENLAAYAPEVKLGDAQH